MHGYRAELSFVRYPSLFWHSVHRVLSELMTIDERYVDTSVTHDCSSLGILDSSSVFPFSISIRSHVAAYDCLSGALNDVSTAIFLLIKEQDRSSLKTMTLIMRFHIHEDLEYRSTYVPQNAKYSRSSSEQKEEDPEHYFYKWLRHWYNEDDDNEDHEENNDISSYENHDDRDHDQLVRTTTSWSKSKKHVCSKSRRQERDWRWRPRWSRQRRRGKRRYRYWSSSSS